MYVCVCEVGSGCVCASVSLGFPGRRGRGSVDLGCACAHLAPTKKSRGFYQARHRTQGSDRVPSGFSPWRFRLAKARS